MRTMRILHFVLNHMSSLILCMIIQLYEPTPLRVPRVKHKPKFCHRPWTMVLKLCLGKYLSRYFKKGWLLKLD